MQPTYNLRVVESTALPSPRETRERLPLSEHAAETVLRGRTEIQELLAGRDDRQLVIVGPCSVHDVAAALDYATRLQALKTRLEDDLLIVMRVYFEKPRTTVGWKGLINDPHIDGSCDITAGLDLARSLLLQIAELDLPAATELLDPIIPQYISDLVSWAAIGARTTESQTHREMSSGLSMPVGFKNGTDGSLDVAINAMIAAGQPHSFLGIDDEGRVGIVRTAGNPHSHIVLRGGSRGPNFDRESIAESARALRASGAQERILVDCNHGNSGKDYRRQPAVLASLAEQIREGDTPLLGAMIESNLRAGRQDVCEQLEYGMSITDACVDFDLTAMMLEDFASAVAAARNASRPPAPHSSIPYSLSRR